jgi:hypothetical protein
MLIFTKNLYLNFIFKLYCNKWVVVNYANELCPTFNTYYNGPEFSGYKVASSAEEFQEEKCIEMVFVNNSQQINLNTSSLYIFCANNGVNNPISIYRDIFFIPNVMKILVESPVFLFLKERVLESPEKIKIEIKNNGGGYPWNVLNFTFFIILMMLVCRVSRNIINRLSKMDPIFTNFNIVSSDIKKFKDVIDKSMIECPICFEKFESESDVRMLDCKHYFHPECIGRWLMEPSKKCPCCRNEIVINEKV